MDKQELINTLKAQAESFEEDIDHKLEYLNSDEVFSEYTRGLGIDDEDDDEYDDDDDDDEDDDEDEDDDDEDDDEDDENVDPETLKKQKLAAKIAAMRGLAAPNFLKK